MNVSIALAVALIAATTTTTTSAEDPATARPAKLTRIENAYPDFSPDGTHLVFQSDRDGISHLYTMNSADGSGVRTLTHGAGADAGPHYSPDGSKIVYASEIEHRVEIYVIAANGGEPIQLTHFGADTSHPSWSPDGTRIVFCSNKDTPDRTIDWWDQHHEIYSMRADGSDVRRITDFRTVSTFPVYSPDGSRIAFRKVIRTPGFYDDKNLTLAQTNSEVFVMKSDGSSEINLSRSAAYDGWPAWSPDGKRIAFGSNRGMVTQLYVVDADGSHLMRLLDERGTEEDTRPDWSPDGSKIAFTRLVDGNIDIYVMSAPAARSD